MSVHKRYVQKLYKKSLKLANDWYWQVDEARAKQMIIRKLFDDNKDLSSPQDIMQTLKQTEYYLAYYAHPQPYIRPSAPGESKWERNVPFPEEVFFIKKLIKVM